MCGMAASFRHARAAATGMSTPRRGMYLLLIGLTLLASSALALWLSQHLVQRSEEIYTGFGNAAQRNPFYAAERLLTRLGRTVSSIERLRAVPDPLPPADALLLALPSYALSAAEGQRLLDWVSAGGHLLLGVQHEYEPHQGLDHLLNRLQVRSAAAQTANGAVAVQLDDRLPPLQVDFRSRLRLNDAPWLQLRWGRGRVTLLSDLSVFGNWRLDEHDHAAFLWALAQQQPAGAIWLQYQTLTPSLAHLLWQHGWPVLLGLLLSLLTALWHYSRRLGPLLTPRATAQRRLGEHLRASSRFLWRQGAGPLLLHATRHYTLRRLQARHGSTAPELSGILRDSDQPLDDDALLQTLQSLQSLQSLHTRLQTVQHPDRDAL